MDLYQYYYGLTVRETRSPSITKYNQYFSNLREQIGCRVYLDWYLEGTKGLHSHAIIASPKRITKLQIMAAKPTPRGWNILFEKLEKGTDTWYQYIRKDVCKEAHLVAEEYDKEIPDTDTSIESPSILYEIDDSENEKLIQIKKSGKNLFTLSVKNRDVQSDSDATVSDSAE